MLRLYILQEFIGFKLFSYFILYYICNTHNTNYKYK